MSSEPASLMKADVCRWAADENGYHAGHARRGRAEQATAWALAWARPRLSSFEDVPPLGMQVNRRRRKLMVRECKRFVRQRMFGGGIIESILIAILVGIIAKFIVEWLFRIFRRQGGTMLRMRATGELDW